MLDIYLVGGAVRDGLMDKPIGDRDWVVIGATVDEMLALGYRQVGKDFPVFLHPETQEEYALARTEKKVGAGYYGFECHADPSVTLEEDLLRRDLTINAMAKDQKGEVIDPYGGGSDLENKILRHVSPAFVEDPVRILRVARFAARFSDFEVANETKSMMQQMVNAGETKELVAERVWQEMERALAYASPWRFFQVLADVGALSDIMNPLALSQSDIERIGELQTTGVAQVLFVFLYRQPIEDIQHFMSRLKISKVVQSTILLAVKYHDLFPQLGAADAATFVRLFQGLDALRRPERLQAYLGCCALLYPASQDRDRIQCAWKAYIGIDVAQIVQQGHKGLVLADEIVKARQQAVAAVLV